MKQSGCPHGLGKEVRFLKSGGSGGYTSASNALIGTLTGAAVGEHTNGGTPKNVLSEVTHCKYGVRVIPEYYLRRFMESKGMVISGTPYWSKVRFPAYPLTPVRFR